MDPDRQMLASMLHDINWGPLDHASRIPQFLDCKYTCVCVCMCVCVCVCVGAYDKYTN